MTISTGAAAVETGDNRALFAAGIAERLAQNKALTEKHGFAFEGREFVIYPHVFSPLIFKDAVFYLRNFQVQAGQSFLEMGCGAGLMAVLAALNGAAKVAAVDLNPYAVANTRENAALHGVADLVQVYEGSVFDPIPAGEKFDRIFWNLPHALGDKQENLDLDDRNVHDPGYTVIADYFKHGRDYLTPNGKLLVGFSSSVGDVAQLDLLTTTYGWQRSLVCQKSFPGFHNISLEIYQFT